jgi:hypothetical protein
MTFTPEQQKKILIALASALALLIVFRIATSEKPKTAPLTYTPGAAAGSPVRQGLMSRTAGTDPLNVFLAQREEKFPGVARDIFRMRNPAPKPKPAPPPPPPPPPPVKTPEELAAEAAAQAAAEAARIAAERERAAAEAKRVAAEAARADLSKFRFLGYLTEKDNTLFLSKDGENFIVKRGDKVLKSYKIKETGKDHVILFDTVTRVEVRVELSGGENSPQNSPQNPQPQQPPQPPRLR